MRFDVLKNKKGQIALYVIIAIVVVALIVLFFVFRGTLFAPAVPAELQPVFTYYEQCMQEQTRAAVDLASSQGGRVDPGAYIPGSEYAPFSSQLNFLGFPVPYWYYIAGNGVIKENVPTKNDMEEGISKYVTDNLNLRCNFDEFYDAGFVIEAGEPVVETTISDNLVSVDVSANVRVSKGESSAVKTSHSTELKTNFGKLYSTAIAIYEKEKTESFLENYSVDTLRLYAPVDGVEIGCAGKIWRTRQVVEDLKGALEANVAAIRFKGDYYSLASKEESYFVVNLPVDESVNMIYSRSWPTRVEVYGADSELMTAEPVGAKEGAGALGFCYAPYHFVYDVSYPVLIQVYDDSGIFQFPVVVVIDKNFPRQGIYTNIGYETEGPDVCAFRTEEISVNLYDVNLNRVDANLSFECFDKTCALGESVDGTFTGMAPACVNGYIEAKAAGYADKRELISTNEQKVLDLIMDREYNVSVEIEVGGEPLGDRTAMVVFNGAQTRSVTLPDVPNAMMSEGFYNVSVYVYSNSSITIPASTRRQCSEVSTGGLGALFGQTEEKCFNIDIPATKIESGLVGGGKSEIYILPSDLAKGTLKLKVDSLLTPNSIEQLQSNFELFDVMHVELDYGV